MPVELNRFYGRLFTVARLSNSDGRTRWLCWCACGKPFLKVRGDMLLSGKSTSCGCSRRRALGLANSPTYKTWAAMRRRCNDPKHPRYSDYGGRGIRVCDRWNDSRTGFAAFVADVGLRPPERTLDRIDVDRGYEPGNVKWATIIEQRWNRRDMRIALQEKSEWDAWEEIAREAEAMV